MAETLPPRILVVDDEALHMKALCDTLMEHGYDTVGCTGGKDALNALEGAEFDLLLADLMMPELNGIALLQAALKLDSNLVGVIMTGKGTIATAVEAMKAGALDYIIKPFKLNAILPVLSRALVVRRLRMENAELGRQVTERTQELEAANKELEAFSYSVSHDLRAPLRIIDGFSQALLDDHAGQLDEKGRDCLRKVRAGAQRMGELIDDLLKLSRITSADLSRNHVDVSALARAVGEELKRKEPERRVSLLIREGLVAEADSRLMRIVLENLLGNAWKFTTKTGEPRIEIGAEQHDESAVFVVRDNGAGFDMIYAGKLFRPFQRLHRESDFPGTGIGLATVRRIIERHGGRVWAEGAPGRGASVYFTLAPPAKGKAAVSTTLR
jgi:signal transduction histidine kinase